MTAHWPLMTATMTDWLLPLSYLLIKAGFEFGLPCAARAMLLLVGLKRRGRPTLLIALLAFIGLASLLAGLALQAVTDGEVLSVLWFGPSEVQRDQQPLLFWLSVTVWLSGALSCTCWCLWRGWRLLRPVRVAGSV